MQSSWRVAALGLCLLFRCMAVSPADSAEEHAQSILSDGIKARDPQIRLQAVIASSMIGKQAAVLHRLEDVLISDKDVAVRVAAANALGDFRARETAPTLKKALHDDAVPEVAYAAAKALYTLKDPAGKEALMEIFDRKISTRSNALRKQARNFFGKFHSLKSTLLTLFNEGVGFVPVPGAGAGATAVVELLSDPELSDRASVLLMLCKNKNKEGTELLRKGLYDKDWSVRASAAQCIAQTARMDLKESIVPLLDDTKDKVKFRAAGAYIHLNLITKRTK